MARVEDHERVIAQLITGSLGRGGKWSELTPLSIAKHLVANGVRFVVDVEKFDARRS